jgi:hypothetical protein
MEARSDAPRLGAVNKTRGAAPPQVGHADGSLQALIGRIASNNPWVSHQYS